MAITIFSSSARGRSFRICAWERLHASRYDVCGFTTAGTSSTASDPQSLALCRDVRIPARLFSTAVASLDESGYFQWSMFITESMRTFALSTAFLMGRGAGGGVARMPLDAGAGVFFLMIRRPPRPVEQAVITEVFRNSRR